MISIEEKREVSRIVGSGGYKDSFRATLAAIRTNGLQNVCAYLKANATGKKSDEANIVLAVIGTPDFSLRGTIKCAEKLRWAEISANSDYSQETKLFKL